MPVRRHGHDKLRPANRAVGGRSFHIDLPRFFAAEEVTGALLHVQRRLGRGHRWWQDFSLEKLVDPKDARITQTKRGPTVFPGPQPIVPGQLLTHGSRSPRACRTGRVNLVLLGNNHSSIRFVRGLRVGAARNRHSEEYDEEKGS